MLVERPLREPVEEPQQGLSVLMGIDNLRDMVRLELGGQPKE